MLMGGQACVLYGAAEFSRDVDVLVDPADTNVDRLRTALADLQTEQVFVPSLDPAALRRGHACHFRCRAPGVERLRIDIMSRIRGGPGFEAPWRRRQSLRTPRAGRIDVLSPPDLVRAKKTQRDKVWPMIARLVEVHYRANMNRAMASNVRFWLMEARSAELLLKLVGRFPRSAARLRKRRAAVARALSGDAAGVRRELFAEQEQERTADREYWTPLRAELARWRMQRMRKPRRPNSR